MTKKDENTADVVRRPYRAPRIVESGSFEHLVLACTQQPGNPRFGGCGDPEPIGPANS